MLQTRIRCLDRSRPLWSTAGRCLALWVVTWALGCGVEGGDFAAGGASEGAACADGVRRRCHQVLDDQGTLSQCFDGEQWCLNGAWGSCDEALTSEDPDEEVSGANGTSPLSLSVPQPCGASNPCDPTCHTFKEAPAGPLVPGGSASPYNYVSGPEETFSYPVQVWKSNCDDAGDCQLDYYCNNPHTPGPTVNCPQSVCSPGLSFDNDCASDCVQAVCAADPSCCYDHGCAHDPCTPGARLPKDCDKPTLAKPGAWNCVTTICNTPGYAYCCATAAAGGKWDQACVDAMKTVCGKTCRAWDSACVEKVYSVCGATCLSSPPCAHHPAYEGAALDASCNDCVEHVCAVDTDADADGINDGKAACCNSTSQWDASCVAQTALICDLSASPDGECLPRATGSIDENCAKSDLTIGVPCKNAAGALHFPICNHGTLPAPSGVHTAYFKGAAGQVGKEPPDMTKVFGWCPDTVLPIPPGYCYDVTCPGLVPEYEIMVNPPSVAGKARVASECFYANNYAVFDDDACGPASCVGSPKTLDIKEDRVILVWDRSVSMRGKKWEATQIALTKFIQDPGNDGLALALRFFPDYRAETTASPGCSLSGGGQPHCDPAQCAIFDFPGVLKANQATVAKKETCQGDANALKYPYLSGVDLMAPGDASVQFLKKSYAPLVAPKYPLDPASAATKCVKPHYATARNPATFGSGDYGKVGAGLYYNLTGANDDVQEGRLLSAIWNSNIYYGTPLGHALVGGKLWAENQWKTAGVHDPALKAKRDVTIVLVTDGQPYGCAAPNNMTDIKATAAAAFAAGIKVYTVGLNGSRKKDLEEVASLGGGSHFDITTNNKTSPFAACHDLGSVENVAGCLAQSLGQIRNEVMACEFDLPDKGTFDPLGAQLSYTPPGGGPPVALHQVADGAACVTCPPGAKCWHYNDATDPSTIQLCDAACEEVRGATGTPPGKLTIDVQCSQVYAPKVFKFPYHAECAEALDQCSQWAYLAWDASVPGNSSIDFEIRVAKTAAALAAATFHKVVTVSTANANAQCSLGSGCAESLYALLKDKGLSVQDAYLELRVTLRPDPGNLTIAPSLNDWEITYSCPECQ